MDMEDIIPDTALSDAGVIPVDAGQENRLSWEQILEDPEYRQCYDKAIQRIVQRRLKERHEAEKKLEKLMPVLKALSERYGVEAESMDAQSIAELILGEIRNADRAKEKVLGHMVRLLEQEREMKESFPEFELMAALEDPDFIRLTAPHTGLSLMQAYCALNREAIRAEAARESMAAISRSLRSGGARPYEAQDSRDNKGISRDPRSMSKAEREELKKKIYEAKAKGEKIGCGR